jgi:Ni,Fe-hydrogenase I large subunit
MRSKNDSLNGSENGKVFKSKFYQLEAIDDMEESKYGQVMSFENQELLVSKLANLQEYHSGTQSFKNSGKKPSKIKKCQMFSNSSWFGSSGEKSPSSSVTTPVNAINFQNIQHMNFNTSAKSSGLINCSTEGQEEALDLQSPETKTCLFKRLYALKEEHQMYESDNNER